MCPNICRSYQKINFKILSLLSLIAFMLNFNLQAQTTPTLSQAAQAQRTQMATNLTNTLSTFFSKGTVGTSLPAWATLQTALKTNGLNIGLKPSDVLKLVFRSYSYIGLYNLIAHTHGSNLLTVVDPNGDIPVSLMYFGDGSGSGVVSQYGEPGNNTMLPTTEPLAAFFMPGSSAYNFASQYPSAQGNFFEGQSGIVMKTKQFCNDLDTTYAASQPAGNAWLGATCVSINDCCQNAYGQSKGYGSAGTTAIPVGESGYVDCISPGGAGFPQAPVMPDPKDPTGKTMIPYGICDVVAPSCAKVNAACTGSGAGNCCQTPVTLTCDTSNSCKILAGQACTPGNKDCEAGAICEPNVSAPTTGICKMSLGHPCSDAAGCVTGTSCGNVPAFGSNAALTNVCSIALNDSCAGTGALYCQTKSICDIGASASICVVAGQIKTGDSGCFANSDCASGGCSVAGGVTPGVCQCVMSTSGCKTDTDCCVGTGSCDLTTGKCVLNSVGIPAGDDCYSDGVTAIGETVYPASVCVTGQNCQVDESGQAANFCQACAYGAVNSGTAQAPVYQAPTYCTGTCCGGATCSNSTLTCCNPTGGYCQVATQSQDCCSGTCNNGQCA